MKPPRGFGPLPHVRYRPELASCPHCAAALVSSHPVWAKPIQFLSGAEHVTNLGFRCSAPACPFARTVYRSARAEARQVKGSGYGLDVVVRIGQLRFTAHRTREEIWRALREPRDHAPIQLSERHVQNLLDVYLAVLRASQQDLAAAVAATVAKHGGLILALDGLQPEQGNEQLWVVREVLGGAILGAANLQQATAECLGRLLQPVRATGVPVLGVVSDAQESIRLAVAAVFPGVPHQLCQWHALREAAEPLWEADRHLLVEVKQALRPLRDVEERTRSHDPGAADLTSGVVLDTVLALRQTVRERGTLPFDFAALRVLDDLRALGQSLDRCLQKRGSHGWRDSGLSSSAPWTGLPNGPATWPTPTPGSSPSGTRWSLPLIRPPSDSPPGPSFAPGSRRTWTT
jgi:hypothetical protein